METQPPTQTLSVPASLECKYCKALVIDTFYFCPNCGKKLKEPPFKFSISKSIGVLTFSILFPPFGIIPGIRYFLKDDHRAQAIGIAAIAITIISSILLVLYSIKFINQTVNTYNQIYQMQEVINSPSSSAQDQIQELQKAGF